MANISLDIVLMALKQLGATEIDSTATKISVIKFVISPELTVSYIVSAREEDKLYLQRVEPYPIRNTKFDHVDNIIKFITKDVKRFRNAANSSNFNTFLDIVQKNYKIRTEIEDFFLIHNVDKDFMNSVLEDLDVLIEKIKTEEEKAEKIEVVL